MRKWLIRPADPRLWGQKQFHLLRRRQRGDTTWLEWTVGVFPSIAKAMSNIRQQEREEYLAAIDSLTGESKVRQ